MRGLRVAPACLRSVLAAALCVAPLLAPGATAEKVKAALDAYEPSVDAQNGEFLLMRMAEIEAVLELPAERLAAVQAVEEKTLEEGRKAWRRRAEKSLGDPSLPNEQLLPGMSVEADPETDMQPAWKEGLAKVLTPEESKRLADRHTERKARRTRNLAELFLLLLDEKLALSTQQRARMLPIAEKLVGKVQEMLPAEVEQDEDLFNPAILLSAGKDAPEKEVRAILVDAQWARWQKACVPPTNQEAQGLGVIPGLLPPPPDSAPVPNSAAPAPGESVDQVLSNFMATQAGHQRQRLLAPLLLQIEEAARVADLSPQVCARLQIAARGAAEKSLQKWAPQFQQYIRNNLQEVTAENISQALARLGNPVVFQAPNGGAPKPGIFEKALHAELTPAQLAAWQKEIDARREFRTQTIIRSMLTGFDRIVPLRTEQFAKLSSMLTVLLADYREEMDPAGSPEQGPWYLQSEARSAPLAGLAPAEMEALLGKGRWERWTKSEEYNDAKSCWNNLKENHQNRRR
jgi:hypothetical protein